MASGTVGMVDPHSLPSLAGVPRNHTASPQAEAGSRATGSCWHRRQDSSAEGREEWEWWWGQEEVVLHPTLSLACTQNVLHIVCVY